MNCNLILRAICLGGIYFISAETIKDEFKRFEQSEDYKHFFSLTEQEKDQRAINQNMQRFSELKNEIESASINKGVKEILIGSVNMIIKRIPEKRTVTSEDHQLLELKRLEEYIAKISNGTPAERALVVKMVNKIKRYYKSSQNLKIHSHLMHLPKKDFPLVYSFVSAICRANNLEVPQMYVESLDDPTATLSPYAIPSYAAFLLSTSYGSSKFKETHSIIISSSIFKIFGEEGIKAIIAHELGHMYYNDAERCSKFSNDEIMKKMNHMREYRADLFAAQYGLGSALARSLYLLSWNPFMDYSKLESASHPAPINRMNVLKTLPVAPALYEKPKNTFWDYLPFWRKSDILRTEYRPSFSEGKLRLEPITKPAYPVAPKIVSSSAQPLRPNLRAVQVALQAAKRLPK
ncbi:MAG: hypothetical protein K2X90_00345 [Candidatus Babeliaceae bacterium]|nr:hypothetical protein [Candidatus Babeliaceae bacterium]